MFQVLAFSNNMEYEEVDNVNNIRAGSFYTTPNRNKSLYSFLREDDDKYLYNYDYLPVSNDRIREITWDNHYDPKIVILLNLNLILKQQLHLINS